MRNCKNVSGICSQKKLLTSFRNKIGDCLDDGTLTEAHLCLNEEKAKIIRNPNISISMVRDNNHRFLDYLEIVI